MKKYRKNMCIEVIDILDNGDVLVQNEGDPSDQWIIPRELFERSYDEVKE